MSIPRATAQMTTTPTTSSSSSSSSSSSISAIASIISTLRRDYESNCLTPVEFVAAYIMAIVKMNHQSRWMGGRRPRSNSNSHSNSNLQPAVNNDANDQLNLATATSSLSSLSLSSSSSASPPTPPLLNTSLFNISTNLPAAKWRKLSEFEWLELSESDKKKLQGSGAFSFIDLFHEWHLCKLPEYVNDAIVNWANGRRRVKLMFSAPTPLEMLQLQASGYRCVTAFCEESELSRILQDPYPPYEKRDALKFLVHDLQHLEKFQCEYFYYEQVAFYSLISGVENKIPFNDDLEYRNDLDHAYSDMNACCVHLLGFLKAKSKLTEQRRHSPSPDYRLTPSQNEQFERDFVNFLNIWNFGDDLLGALHRLCEDTFTKEDADLIRQYFHDKGCQLLQEHFPLIQETNIKTKKTS